MTADDAGRIRRQVYELTLSDLEAFPAWEFALDEEDVDGQDEATVRPYLAEPVDPSDGGIVVRAKFVLADGTMAIGHVSPQPHSFPSDIRDHHPSIITDRGQVDFCFGIFLPPAERLETCLAALGKSSVEVFPIEYETDVQVVGGPTKGKILGFSYLTLGQEGEIIETVRL